MIHHSMQNITIEIDKLIDTVIVVGDKVDENAIANQVIAALNKAVENAHKTDPRLIVTRWGIPQPKIKRDDLKDWVKAFDAARIPMSCFTRACADFVHASVEAAKDREKRRAELLTRFDLFCYYYFPDYKPTHLHRDILDRIFNDK